MERRGFLAGLIAILSCGRERGGQSKTLPNAEGLVAQPFLDASKALDNLPCPEPRFVYYVAPPGDVQVVSMYEDGKLVYCGEKV